MDLYHYDPVTGEYLGSSVAEESPLEPGVYLIPAHCVAKAPPQAQPGQIMTWSDGEWAVVSPAPAPDPEPVPQPTAEEVALGIAMAVQAHLDAQARSMGYESIQSAVTYADEPAVARFQIEGRALREWRSVTWAFCYALVDRYRAGLIGPMTAEQVVAALPKFSAPLAPQDEAMPVLSPANVSLTDQEN